MAEPDVISQAIENRTREQVQPPNLPGTLETPRLSPLAPERVMWCQNCGFQTFRLGGSQGNRFYICQKCGECQSYLITIHKGQKGIVPYADMDKEFDELRKEQGL